MSLGIFTMYIYYKLPVYSIYSVIFMFDEEKICIKMKNVTCLIEW